MLSLLRPVLALAVFALCMAPAQAQLQVTISEGNVDPLPIAIPDLIGEDAQAAEAGADMARVITANLENSGLFDPVDPDAFIERINDINARPRFSDWRVIDASALLTGEVTVDAEGRLVVAFRLWDTAAEEQMLGLRYVSVPENWRRLAHKISDAVYERLTGESGYFDTKIVYVAESGEGENTARRLVIMDQDGANPSYLTSRDYMALLPSYSPTDQQISYVSFTGGQAQSYLYDLQTGQQEALFDGSGPNLSDSGQSLSARFHPNGREVVLSAARGGQHDIFRLNLRNRQIRQITSGSADDTEPTFSPEGDQIVFTSNRGGQPQIYVAGADGGSPERISFGGGRYNSPVWSPRGDLIAFVKQTGSTFSLGVLRADGSGQERILYEGYFVDTPTWSPNGRVLLFTRGDYASDGTEYSIWSVDLGGFNLRRVPTQGEASDPAWSPLLD